MRNSGISIYDYTHSFKGEDFYSNALYWNINIYEYVYVGTYMCMF